MKRHYTIIVSLIIAATILLWLLAAIVPNPNNLKNGFVRHAKPIHSAVAAMAKFDNIFTVVSFKEGKFYFGSNKPGLIFISDSLLTSLDTLSLTGLPATLGSAFYTTIDFPFIFIVGANDKTVITGNLNNGKWVSTYIGGHPVTHAVPFSNSQFVLRCIDTNTLNAFFIRKDIGSNSTKTESGISAKNHDAGFSDDGKLLYDSVSRKFIYYSFYSNHIICFDSNLNVIYKSRTIDSFNIPRVFVTRTPTSVTHKKPPQMVNAAGCINDGKLFIHSLVRADNETVDYLNNNDAIDVYNVANGLYLYSIYIPSAWGEKFRNFKIINGSGLLVLYTMHVIKYRLEL